MTPYEAYQKFLALKMHFTSDYDAVKYNFKTNANPTSFETRKDKYFFHKLSKHRDLDNYLVSNFVVSDPKWVGDLVDERAEQNYTEWKRRQESFTYNFSVEIGKMLPEFNDNFLVKDGQHPPFLKLLLKRDVSLETFIVVNDVVNFFNYWNKSIDDTIIWPMIYRKCTKYKPFFHYDAFKCRKIMKEAFT